MIFEFPKHLSPKKKIRKCHICQKDFEWSELKGSAWYGNYIIEGKGYDAHEKENVEFVVCSSACMNTFNLYRNSQKL